MQPRCLVLDEPTAMLDPRGRREVMDTVRRLNREEGITVIFITHFMEEALEAGRVAVMESGRIVLDGYPREVFGKVERLRQMDLDVPSIGVLAELLRREGVPLTGSPLTVEEMVEELCPLLKLEMSP